jgi:hypothetical protein
MVRKPQSCKSHANLAQRLCPRRACAVIATFAPDLRGICSWMPGAPRKTVLDMIVIKVFFLFSCTVGMMLLYVVSSIVACSPKLWGRPKKKLLHDCFLTSNTKIQHYNNNIIIFLHQASGRSVVYEAHYLYICAFVCLCVRAFMRALRKCNQ